MARKVNPLFAQPEFPELPIIRTSERNSFNNCWQQWWWSYREGLLMQGPPALHFWFGILIHEALASHYQRGLTRGKGKHGLVQVFRRLVDNELHMLKTWEGDSVEYVDAATLGEEMLTNYLDEFGRDDHMDILSTEKIRFVTIYDHDNQPVATYAYTMDGVYRDRSDHDKIKLLEHKTAAMFNFGHLPLDPQARSYVAFETLNLREEGLLKPDEHIQEITFNFLRKAKKKIDDRPTNKEGLRLNQNGTISKQQKVQEPLFARVPVSVSRESRARVVDTIILEAQDMLRLRRDPYLVRKMPKQGPMGCVSCQFKDMCELHEEGGDWQDLRDWKFQVQDPYKVYRKAA